MARPRTAAPYRSTSSFAFLGKRQGCPTACITGGEPLLQSGIDEFCTCVRAGVRREVGHERQLSGPFARFVEEGLVDYVATDVKNAPERYAETVACPPRSTSRWCRSLDSCVRARSPTRCAPPWCASCTPPTTCARWLRIEGVQAWHLQSFIDADSVLAAKVASTHGTPDDLRALAARAAGRRAGRSAARGGLEPRGSAPSHAASTRLLRIPNSANRGTRGTRTAQHPAKPGSA